MEFTCIHTIHLDHTYPEARTEFPLLPGAYVRYIGVQLILYRLECMQRHTDPGTSRKAESCIRRARMAAKMSAGTPVAIEGGAAVSVGMGFSRSAGKGCSEY